MIVEFVGAPAAGKSTLARETYRKLSMISASLHNGSGNFRLDGAPLPRGEVYLDRVLSPLVSPALALWCAVNARSKERFSDLLGLSRRARFVRRLRNIPRVHLINEGPFRQACTLRSRHPLAFGDFVFDHIPLPDLAVVVTVDPTVALERLRMRGEQTVSVDWTDSEILEFVSRNQEFTLRTIERLGVSSIVSPSADELADRLRYETRTAR